MGFSERPDRNIGKLDQESRHEKIGLKVEKVHKYAYELLKTSRIDMKEFMDEEIYGKQAVVADMQEVMRLLKIFEQEEKQLTSEEAGVNQMNKKFATIAEAAIFRGIKDEKWLGEGAHVQATSIYDEKKNGIDLSIEFNEKNRGTAYLGLGVDVTFAREIGKKFRRIESEIREGKLTSIRYFKSSDGTIRGNRSMVPRVIVGVDPKRLEQILARWDGEGRNPLQEPLVHESILEEIRMQLEVFRSFAQSKGLTEISEAYERDLDIINDIARKKKRVHSIEELAQDRVFQSIMTNLERFKS